MALHRIEMARQNWEVTKAASNSAPPLFSAWR